MKMHSDLGKMFRRNYMVKSHLNSLEAKSRSLNEKINDETKIDEWAESYITRADAQIDDVSDYMEFRKLGALGHVRHPAPRTVGLPAPKLPVYGQQRAAAPQAEAPLEGVTEYFPQMGVASGTGYALMIGTMAGVLGIITYDEYQSKGNIRAAVMPRLKRAGMFAGLGAAATVIASGVLAGGQKTGWY